MKSPEPIDVRIDSLDHLFEAPPRDPWADGPTNPRSGLEQILRQIERAPLRRSNEIYIEVARLDEGDLPRLEHAPAALRNLALARSEELTAEASKMRARGLRTLKVGSLVAALAMGVATGVEQWAPEHLLTLVLSESIAVLGWVILWRPLDVLMFDVWEARLRRRAFERIARAKIVVTAQKISAIRVASS